MGDTKAVRLHRSQGELGHLRLPGVAVVGNGSGQSVRPGDNLTCRWDAQAHQTSTVEVAAEGFVAHLVPLLNRRGEATMKFWQIVVSRCFLRACAGLGAGQEAGRGHRWSFACHLVRSPADIMRVGPLAVLIDGRIVTRRASGYASPTGQSY